MFSPKCVPNDPFGVAGTLVNDTNTLLCGNPLLIFELVTDEFVFKIIMNTPNKTCELDLTHITIICEKHDIPLSSITNINTSITTGIMQRDLKTAIVKIRSKGWHHLTKI